jgi:hypothetical protein
MSSEVPCCVCGEWGHFKTQLDCKLLKPAVLRRAVSGMLPEKLLCPQCVSRCAECRSVVIWHQKRECRGLCYTCFGALRN